MQKPFPPHYRLLPMPPVATRALFLSADRIIQVSILNPLGLPIGYGRFPEGFRATGTDIH
jgi:hypothetical protein